MDPQERLLLIGEQTVLSEERALVNANRHALQAKVLSIYNEITGTFGPPRWLEKAQQVLTDLHAAQARLVELDVRITEIKRLTGR